MATSKKVLTTKAFAEAAGVSPSTVSSWIKKGKITAKKEGNRWLIPESELNKTATTNPKATTAAAKPKASVKASRSKSPAKKAKTSSQKTQPAVGGRSFSIEAFSNMTFLTAFGVKKWLKEGRLTGGVDASGNGYVDATNLENPLVKRLLR